MKQYFSALLIVIFLTNTGRCQKGSVWLSGGPSLGFAVSNKNFSYYYKNGVGGNLQANFGVARLGSITAHLSYLSFGAKNLPVTDASSSTLLKAGYQTYFSNSGFFVGADAGFSFYGYGIFSGRTRFVAGATVGYSFKIVKKNYIDIFPSYNQVFSTPNNNKWLMANICYRFGLTKK